MLRYIMPCVAACVVLFPSCKEERMEIDTDADRRIYLRAMVEGTTATTRVPYILTAPERNNPLNVAVWASTTQHVFTHTDGANGKNGTVALHTTANFTNGSEQLLNEAVYPKATSGTTSTVYFVGLHPQAGWTTADGQTATHATVIDGKTDVMFAPKISGTYGGNTDNTTWPTFKFHHLLTWLRIQMVAESEEVSKAWGKVTGLTIQSKKEISIDLSKEEANIANAATFSGDIDLNFYRTDADVTFPGTDGYLLKGPYGSTDYKPYIEEVAYVLCAPVEATEKDTETENKTTEYTLTVTTERRTVTVDVDLMDGDGSYFDKSTRNHQFVLLLKFKMGDNISVIAQPVDWKTGGLGSGELKEDGD